jgi:hypothetical protein
LSAKAASLAHKKASESLEYSIAKDFIPYITYGSIDGHKVFRRGIVQKFGELVGGSGYVGPGNGRGI